MATKDTKAFLKALNKFVGREVRGTLNTFYTMVTMTDQSLGQGFKEGWNDIQRENSDRNLIQVPDSVFFDIGGKAVNAVHSWASQERTWPLVQEYSPSKLIRYSTRRDVKKAYKIAKDTGVQHFNAYLDSTGATKLSKYNDKDKDGNKLSARKSEVGVFKSSSHRSHQGASTVGAARLSAAMAFLSKTEDFGGFSSSSATKDLMEIYEDIQIKFRTEGTKAGGAKVLLNKDEYIEILLGPRSKNKVGAEPTDWKNLKPELEKAIENYVNSIPYAYRSGSKSIVEHTFDATENLMVDTFLDNIKGAVVVGGRKKTKKQPKKEVKVVEKGTGKKVRKSRKKAAKFVPKKNKAISSKISIVNILPLINAKLPETVAKNMGTPRLENRTGTFASGVKATDMILTPQGFPSIGFTYQKDPYQVFESTSGSRFASAERDPRNIIDFSIREIAAQFALGRLYTRRV